MGLRITTQVVREVSANMLVYHGPQNGNAQIEGSSSSLRIFAFGAGRKFQSHARSTSRGRWL